MDAVVLPPFASLTSDDRGPVVIVVSYILIIHTIFWALIKIGSTYSLLQRTFDWDDGLAIGAAALGIVQTILTALSAVRGVGSRQPQLSSAELELYFKRAYVANLLSVVVRAMAKASAIFLISRLQSTALAGKTFTLLQAVNIGWLVLSIFGIAFQCGLPRPWVINSSQCAGGGAMWFVSLGFSLTTDAVISIVFAPKVWKLQISRRARVRIILLFSVRFVVSVLIVVQMATLAEALRQADITYAMKRPTLFGQWSMNASIMAAVVPSLYKFVSELRTGPGFGGLVSQCYGETSNGKNHCPCSHVEEAKCREQSPCNSAINTSRLQPQARNHTVARGYSGNVGNLESRDLRITQTVTWSLETYNDVEYPDRIVSMHRNVEII